MTLYCTSSIVVEAMLLCPMVCTGYVLYTQNDDEKNVQLCSLYTKFIFPMICMDPDSSGGAQDPTVHQTEGGHGK